MCREDVQSKQKCKDQCNNHSNDVKVHRREQQVQDCQNYAHEKEMPHIGGVMNDETDRRGLSPGGLSSVDVMA